MRCLNERTGRRAQKRHQKIKKTNENHDADGIAFPPKEENSKAMARTRGDETRPSPPKERLESLQKRKNNRRGARRELKGGL